MLLDVQTDGDRDAFMQQHKTEIIRGQLLLKFMDARLLN